MERYEATVGADRRLSAIGDEVPSAKGDTDAFGPAILPVSDENVGLTVGIAVDECCRIGLEGHEAAVGTDRRLVAGAEGDLRTSVREIHADGGSRLAVAYEDVVLRIGIISDKTGGERGESDEAPVGSNPRIVAFLIDVNSGRLVARAVDAHARGRIGLPVVHEDVADTVGVPADEVGGSRREGHELGHRR